MLKNFDELKKQLTELAAVINLYKTESVQLKIVELVFQGTAEEVPDEAETVISTKRVKRSERAPIKTGDPSESNKRPIKKSGKLGRIGVLNRLLADGFFKSKKKIGDIADHCRLKLATTVKVTDLSGPLARFVRDGKLDREKNVEGQYEYFQK
jgi:hypothetical protein